ncbi:MAG: AmmeMemoRadiSam system protein A [Chloroflexota bacterium]
MDDRLTQDERSLLLRLARQALEQAVTQGRFTPPALEELPETLRRDGASFVTLTRRGELRGCIGALEAYQPLVLDVCEHAQAAALEDYRFPPVSPAELPEIEIEISRLTPQTELPYSSPEELPARLRPHIDGVTLADGHRRATFLPQVWEKLPDPVVFLGRLCEKMGAAPNAWRTRRLQVKTYQVEEFHEAG